MKYLTTISVICLCAAVVLLSGLTLKDWQIYVIAIIAAVLPIVGYLGAIDEQMEYCREHHISRSMYELVVHTPECLRNEIAECTCEKRLTGEGSVIL